MKYLSIRPERIAVVDAEARDMWVLETAKSTLRRAEALKDATKMAQPTVSELVKLGHPENLADGVVRALEHYRDVDIDRFRRSAADALRTILPDIGPRRADAPERQAPAAKGRPEDKAVKGEEQMHEVKVGADEEEVVLKIIESLDKGKGAPWDALVRPRPGRRSTRSAWRRSSRACSTRGTSTSPSSG